MYQTYPKSSLAMVAAILLAGLALPATLTFPNTVAKTAAGLQIAIFLWALFALRLVLVADQQTWRDALGLPLFLLAAASALQYAPQDTVADVVTRTGFVGLLIGAGFGLALFSLRPKTLGFTINRQFWITLAALCGLIGMNHVYSFPDLPAAALVGDMALLAAVANCVPFGRVPSASDLGKRALNVLSFGLTMACFLITADVANGAFDALESAIRLVAALLVFWLFFPSIERMHVK